MTGAARVAFRASTVDGFPTGPGVGTVARVCEDACSCLLVVRDQDERVPVTVRPADLVRVA
ncbi:MAG: hypothetical protein JWO67_30 [Streptosporangiaceae bacterium]|nr:hypothetical protein [Streptosporangiaceae bacterium]